MCETGCQGQGRATGSTRDINLPPPTPGSVNATMVKRCFNDGPTSQALAANTEPAFSTLTDTDPDVIVRIYDSIQYNWLSC